MRNRLVWTARSTARRLFCGKLVPMAEDCVQYKLQGMKWTISCLT